MNLRLLRRRLIMTVLVLGICITGTSLTMFQRVQHASAAGGPYFTVKVKGETFVAQYMGNAYSNQNGSSVYSDFGQWNEYTVDRFGTWHAFGQFSGNEDVFYNGNGKIQGGINVNVPGIGHIFTYSHEQILNPPLTPPGNTLSLYSQEPKALLGVHFFENPSQTLSDCTYDQANFDNYPNNGSTDSIVDLPGNAEEQACANGADALHGGDLHLRKFYKQFTQLAAAPHTNGPVVASLHRQQAIPLPVILGVASGVFFIGATITGNICNFAACSKSAKKVLAAVSLGMGIISGVLGISGNILTSLKAYAAVSGELAAANVLEAEGVMEMEAVVPGGGPAAADLARQIAVTPVSAAQAYPGR